MYFAAVDQYTHVVLWTSVYVLTSLIYIMSAEVWKCWRWRSFGAYVEVGAVFLVVRLLMLICWDIFMHFAAADQYHRGSWGTFLLDTPYQAHYAESAIETFVSHAQSIHNDSS